MFYGQKNYNQIIGKNGKYRIAETGCFLTGFCNALKDEFNTDDIDPPTLNARFRDGNIYVDADPKDGVLDDLGWSSITAIYPEIVVSATGAGAPPSSNAMVMFRYRSVTKPTNPDGSPNIITHFCWVASAEKRTIIDSWDGVVKSWDVYGGPKQWATYDKIMAPAVQVDPVHPISASSPSVLGNVNVAGLDLSPSMKTDLAAGMSVADFNAKYTALIPGFRPIAISRQLALPASQPAPATPPAPAESVTLTENNNIPVTSTPPESSAAAPAQAEPAAEDWKKSFTEDHGEYVAVKDTNVEDLDGQYPTLVLTKGSPAKIAGSFMKDGKRYYRAEKHFKSGKWYGIPADALQRTDTPPNDDISDAEIKTLKPDTKDKDITLSKEIDEFRANLTKRETLVAVVAKLYGIVLKLKFWRK